VDPLALVLGVPLGSEAAGLVMPEVAGVVPPSNALVSMPGSVDALISMPGFADVLQGGGGEEVVIPSWGLARCWGRASPLPLFTRAATSPLTFFR
jgi:hypothetical protein